MLDEVLSFSGSSGAAAMVAGTAHRFMELLNAVIDVNPAEVVGMAHAVAAAGSHAGFHFDSLAVGEVVRLVETVLTDYRDEVAEGKPLDDLLHLLDIFADVGWPDALRLVWRLDEVFR